MLQVKDPQEVFDEIVLSAIQAELPEGEEIPEGVLNNTYSIFILGEMYGTISTCLAQNIPIPKELWDNPTVQSFVRGDVDDVVVVEPEHKTQGFYQSQLTDDELEAKMANTEFTSIEITEAGINVSDGGATAALKAQGFDLGSLLP